jgi:hypothetical protein
MKFKKLHESHSHLLCVILNGRSFEKIILGKSSYLETRRTCTSIQTCEGVF